jgi:elongation factor G
MTQVPACRPEDIRNVVLIGPGGSGKTSLAEAILHRCGVISRLGSVDDATTIGDFEPEARAHKHSTSSTLLFATRDGRELNFIDTAGHPDFLGQSLAALPVVETALLVVSATGGIDFHARRLFHAAGEAGLARMIVVNKIDLAPASLPGLVEHLRESLGSELHCMNLPTRGATDVVDCFDHDAGESDFDSVAEVHREMLESTVEIEDALLDRYLSGETIDLAELRRCFVEAMSDGHVVPIVFVSARQEVGIDDLVHILCEEAPSPRGGRARRVLRNQEIVELPCDPERPLIAQCFKVASDAYAGKLAMLRIIQGKLDGTTPFVCGPDRKPHRAGHVLKVEGRDHPEIASPAFAGDLVAVAKIEEISVGQLLLAPTIAEAYEAIPPRLPAPMLSLAIEPKRKTDDVKLLTALQRLAEEDPSFHVTQDPQTRELVVSGLGDLHLRVTLEKLQSRFRLDVQTREPKLPYRETVAVRAEGHYRHKKQTGGAGQFAEVFLRVEPLARGEGFEFASEVFGGAIPSQFIPSVEKGVLDALASGDLAGYPVQDVRVVVHDGKSHPVDSKDIAFRTAGRLAFRDACSRARPVLLEPIASLDISVPEGSLGDVTGDLKTRRGHVLGVDTLPGGMVVVHAHAPVAELASYAGQLRGMTGGHGVFAMELSHHEIVPTHVANAVVARRRPSRHEEL